MPFIEPPLAIKEKVQLEKVSIPVLVGVAAVVIALVAFAATSAFSAISGDGFALEKGGGAAEVQGAGLGTEPGGSGDGGADSGRGSPARGSGAGGDASGGDSSGTGVPQGPGAASDSGASRELVVYVCGAVSKPGVYKLPADSRVQAAVKAAGGFAPDAAREALNLAQPLQDGQQVLVPTVGEAQAAAGSSAQSAGESQPGSAQGGASAQAGGPVNINTATLEDLVSLPGVGEATAAKIVASRESEGPFASVEDLTRVSGIGDKKLQSLRDLICV